MTKIKIKVTKDVLKRSSLCGCGGELNFSTNCAFALAVRDIFPKALVLDEYIRPIGYSGAFFPITTKMKKFIVKFDESTSEKRLKMREREFELKIPDWALQLIGNGEIEEVKKIISESKTLELA